MRYIKGNDFEEPSGTQIYKIRKEIKEVKTKVFFVLVMLAMLASLVVPFATPALAVGAESPPGANANGMNMNLAVLPTLAHNGDTIGYYITISNNNSTLPLISADAENIVVTFSAPDATGNPGAPVTIATIPSLLVNQSVTYTYLDTPALLVVLSLNPGVIQAYGESHFDATLLTDPVSIASDTKDIPTIIITSCIEVTKTANPTTSKAGDTVTYTINVCNCGDIALENVYVIDDMLGNLSASYADTLAVGACESHDFTRVILDTDPQMLQNCVDVYGEPVGPLTNQVTDRDCAHVNVIKPARCRITGGGTIGSDREPRVTHGFELHCNANQLPNRLEVNWGGNKFHLLKLTNAICTDDPSISPNPPRAACDTYEGWGTGRYNGKPGYTAHWIFTDAGEPGVNDWAWIKITDAKGNVVLEVSGFLRFGNQQFHNCTGRDAG